MDNTGLTFSGKSGRYTIAWSKMTAVSNGSERVELWGTAGRLVRMAIPNGGGLAAAGVMHHKVTELTVEFHDPKGAYHGAVFFLPLADGARVLDVSSHIIQPLQHQNESIPTSTSAHQVCSSAPDARTVRVAFPSWSQADVPAAYRAMVYEHIVDRIQRSENVGRVLREGESGPYPVCPKYTVKVSILSFKPGNQVQRSMMGPIGFFAGTTQMVFNVMIQDASERLNTTDQIKATVRGDGESKSVTDAVAKRIAKSYTKTIKQFEKTTTAAGGKSPQLPS
jgi:hypothetical protein